jgi:hypothetical protein
MNVDGDSSSSIDLNDSFNTPSPVAEESLNGGQTPKATTANDWASREALINEILEIDKKSLAKRKVMCLIISLTRSIDALTREAHSKLIKEKKVLGRFTNLVFDQS